MNQYLQLWQLWHNSTRMLFEVPMVMAQRMTMFSQPWTEQTVQEFQLMFVEKAQGWSEAWLIWMKTAPKYTQVAMKNPMDVVTYQRTMSKSVRSANQSIKPLSRRVHANHKRLTR